MGPPPLVVRHVALGKPLPIAGDLTEVRIINSQSQADQAEEGVNVVNVMIYNTGSCSPSFNKVHLVMSIVTLAPIPRMVTLVQRYFNTYPNLSNFRNRAKFRVSLRFL